MELLEQKALEAAELFKAELAAFGQPPRAKAAAVVGQPPRAKVAAVVQPLSGLTPKAAMTTPPDAAMETPYDAMSPLSGLSDSDEDSYFECDRSQKNLDQGEQQPTESKEQAEEEPCSWPHLAEAMVMVEEQAVAKEEEKEEEEEDEAKEEEKEEQLQEEEKTEQQEEEEEKKEQAPWGQLQAPRVVPPKVGMVVPPCRIRSNAGVVVPPHRTPPTQGGQAPKRQRGERGGQNNAFNSMIHMLVARGWKREDAILYALPVKAQNAQGASSSSSGSVVLHPKSQALG